MPFVTSTHIRAEQAVVGERAKHLQTALDRAHAILDVLDHDADHEARAHARRLEASLAASLSAIADRAKALDTVLARTLKEEADGVSDPLTGVPVLSARNIQHGR